MFSNMMQHAWVSVKNPKEGAAIILNFAPSWRALLEMAALVIVLNVFLTQAFALVTPTAPSGSLMATLEAPLPSLLIHAALLAVIVVATFGIGRMMGGSGSLEETFLILIWLQFLMLVANFLQIVVALVWSPLGLFAALLSSVLFLWLFVNFVLVLHGFRSVLKVLLASIASFFAMIFLIAVSVSFFGFFV